jgi:hypothetical protein
VLNSLKCANNPGMVGELQTRGEPIPDVHVEVFEQLTDELKTSQVTEVDFSSCGIGPVALGHLSEWVREATAVVTSINCLNNSLEEGVYTIIKVFEETARIRTLCGLEEGVEHIDWSDSASGKGPADVALLADLE